MQPMVLVYKNLRLTGWCLLANVGIYIEENHGELIWVWNIMEYAMNLMDDYLNGIIQMLDAFFYMGS